MTQRLGPLVNESTTFDIAHPGISHLTKLGDAGRSIYSGSVAPRWQVLQVTVFAPLKLFLLMAFRAAAVVPIGPGPQPWLIRCDRR